MWYNATDTYIGANNAFLLAAFSGRLAVIKLEELFLLRRVVQTIKDAGEYVASFVGIVFRL